MAGAKEKAMRESGFYWVYCDNEWIVAEFDGAFWWLTGMDVPYKEKELIEIGDAVFTPDKYRRS